MLTWVKLSALCEYITYHWEHCGWALRTLWGFIFQRLTNKVGWTWAQERSPRIVALG